MSSSIYSKKTILGNVIVKKLRLPNFFLDNNLFSSFAYRIYEVFRYLKYYYYNLFFNGVVGNNKPVNYKNYSFSISENILFNHEPTIQLSIIIPAYNVADYIVDCLDSVVNSIEGFDSYEIILVEDCSSDLTLKVLNNNKLNYDKIKILVNEVNLGLSGSRNKGLAEAKGSYITFIDSDDMLTKGILSDSMYILKNTEVDIAEFEFKDFDKKIDIESFIQNYSLPGDIEIKKDLSIISNLANGYACGKIYKRDLWNDVRFAEGLYCEDAIIGNIILRRCKSYVKLNKIGYLYRANPNSVSRSIEKRNLGYDHFYMIFYCLRLAKELGLTLNNSFYKRLFVEASNFLNIRTFYLPDSDIYFMFEELNKVFDLDGFEECLSHRQKLMLKSMRDKNISAWRAIAF